MRRRDGCVSEPETVERSRPKVLDQHVGAVQQSLERLRVRLAA